MSTKREALAAELAAIRSLAGLSGRRMAELIGTTQGTLWRIENAKTLPARDLTVRWLDVTSADDETRVRVLGLLHEAHVAAPSWSRRLAGRSHLQDEMGLREQDSVLVRNVQTVMIPGLLQTPEYSRAAIDLAAQDTAGEVDVPTALAARLDRQSILHTPGRTFEFLIAEHVLRWSPADAVLPAQLDRLAQLAGLPSVEIGIIPASTRSLAWSSFVLYTPPDGRDTYVSIELNHSEVVVRQPADVAVYENLYNRLKAAAVTGPDELVRRALS